MTFVETLPLSIPLTVAILAAVFFWRRTLNLQESLNKLVADSAETVANAKAQVDKIPDLIKAAKQKAVDDYIAANPPGGGPVTIDGVTYDSLIEAMQAITADQKGVAAQVDYIPVFFENEAAHGNPWWPNDPPTV